MPIKFNSENMHQKSTLANGLRILTQTLPGTESITALVLVKAGSRWEDKNINGISHFLEHMFFKGAKKYANARAVSEAIDGVGGEFNAFTGKEYAGYYIKVAKTHADLALSVLADMMLHARFDQEEIEKERGVIMEEFNMYQDTPMYQVGWDFEGGLFGDQPLGWDEVGTRDVIAALQREDFVRYKEELYVPENMVLAMAGAIEHEAAKEMIERYFPMEMEKARREMKPYNQGVKGASQVTLKTKKTEQAHLVCGVFGRPALHPDRYVLKVMASLLGGNMSSRMFQAVREDKGLAYYISSSEDSYLDTGTFYTRAGVNVDQIDLAIRAILEEYRKIASEEVSLEELTKAKEYLKGKLTLSLEDSETVAQLMAQHELLYDGVKTFDEVAAAIDAVTIADVRRVAGELFKPGAFHLAVIGPYEDKERFEKLIA